MSTAEAEEDRRSTPLDLIPSAKPAIENPFLRQIVELAPSPSLAHDHIKKLGWSNDTAAAVRNAVRLKMKCEENNLDWEKIAKTSTRPAMALFEFEDASWRNEVRLSAQIRMAHDLRVIPPELVLLREMAMGVPDMGVSDIRYTTFDYEGHTPLIIEEIGENRYRELKAFSGMIPHGRKWRIDIPEEYLPQIELRSGDRPIFFWNDGVLQIRSVSILIEPQKHRHHFPGFYKVVEIRRNDGQERLRIFYRLDEGPFNPHRSTIPFNYPWGHVEFEKCASVSYGSEAVLRVKYLIDGDHKLRFAEQSEPLLFRSSKEIGKNLFRMKPWKAHAALVEVMKAMERIEEKMGTSSTLPLERIAGIHMLTNPPANLLDLLV